MSILSEAFMENLLREGLPVVIIPESALKKKKTIKDGFEERIRGPVINTQRRDYDIVPSPMPG